MPLPSTIVSSVSSGFANITEFEFSASFGADVVASYWDLGNGLIFYDKESIKHVFDYPGFYHIKLTTFDETGAFETITETIHVDYVYRDSVEFTHIPSNYSRPGERTITPFVVSVTSANIKQPICLALYAANSKSIPSKYVPKKWEFLTPRWRFLDAKTLTPVESIIVDTQPIFYDNKIAAVSGTASFYFIDDLSTGQDFTISCPLLLSVTLSTEHFEFPPETLYYSLPSWANSEVARATIVWQVDYAYPARLGITENYINKIYPLKWTGIPIPLIITCEGDYIGHLFEEYLQPIVTYEPITYIYDTLTYLYDILVYGMMTTLSSVALSASTVPHAIMFAYPFSNEIGAVSSVFVALSGASPGSYVFSNQPLYFKFNDEKGHKTGGYILTTLTPLSPIESCVVVASATVFNYVPNTVSDPLSFNFPNGYKLDPTVYVPHNLRGVINRVRLISYPSNCETINYYKSKGIFIEGQTFIHSVSTSSPVSAINYETFGYSGIRGIAYSPVEKFLYTADSETGYLSKYDSKVTLLTSVQLKTLFQQSYVTPSCLSIDSETNVWLVDCDLPLVAKFDKNLNLLLSATPSPIIGLVDSYLSADPAIVGSHIETDIDDNVWVTFCYPLCSFVIKYDSSGNELFTIPFPNFSSPNGIAVCSDNSVWISQEYSYDAFEGEVSLYTSAGVLLSSFDYIARPTYIACDRQSNVWIAHGTRHLTKINRLTGEKNTWFINTDGNILPLTTTVYASSIASENCSWNGCAVDVYNRIWLLDESTNTCYVIRDINQPKAQRAKIFPQSNINFIISPDNENTTTQVENSSTNFPSIQASGDWTGNKWYQKYAEPTLEYSIVGQSSPFTVLDINQKPDLVVYNDNFSMAKYFHQLALPEILSVNNKLFNEFFAAVAGDGSENVFTKAEDPGRKIYERIANFVQNHSDIETCNIQQLLSLAQMLGVKTQTFVDSFPPAVRRLIDIFSINKSKLRGDKLQKFNFNASKGELIDINTRIVTENETIISRSKNYGDYSLVRVSSLSGLSAYPLSSIEIIGFETPIYQHYDFYEFIPDYTISYENNVIDWENPYTTINYEISSVKDWYSEMGVVEKVFNHLLTTTLFKD